MEQRSNIEKTCIIIGASHAGVNAAFHLRKEGWEGRILLFDADPLLPYHRPPLSKAYLMDPDETHWQPLKSAESYEEANIELHLGKKVEFLDAKAKTIRLVNDASYPYDVLILAVGAKALIPNIPGLKQATHIYPIRKAVDATQIKAAFAGLKRKRIVIIGGGYIGLEAAASLKKLGGEEAEITILERADRVLARVTAPETADFFNSLHQQHGVHIHTSKNVTSIQSDGVSDQVLCEDKTQYEADLIILGVGIQVHLELAKQAALEIENGIKVDATCRTSDASIYAIGDCTYHHNPRYNRLIRLESVQNAVDQAKVAAAAICGRPMAYDSIPWFWSDQYDIKLQMVGLSEGYTDTVIRRKHEKSFSVWYFNQDQLLAVDAINNARAYMLGMKVLKKNISLDRQLLGDTSIPIKNAILNTT